MPSERLPMRLVRDCLRLNSTGLPTRKIARRLSTAPLTVRLALRRCEAAGVLGPLADDVADAALEQSFFANSRTKQGYRRHEELNWLAIHHELKRNHMTLQILWEEYINQHPNAIFTRGFIASTESQNVREAVAKLQQAYAFQPRHPVLPQFSPQPGSSYPQRLLGVSSQDLDRWFSAVLFCLSVP